MGELSGMPARDAMQRAHEVLHYVGLADERYRTCDDYSQGMKQRLKLAQALVHDPGLAVPGRTHQRSGSARPRRHPRIDPRPGLEQGAGRHPLDAPAGRRRGGLPGDPGAASRANCWPARPSTRGAPRATQVFEVEGFGNEEAFRAGCATLARGVRARRPPAAGDPGPARGCPGGRLGGGFDTAAGVNAILQVAAASDFALRRLRRRPVTLAEEFYRMVEA